MQHQEVVNHIVGWMSDYVDKSKLNGFVIGISGGIDSALTSDLCAQTGKKVYALNMPILQHSDEYVRAKEHITWLQNRYDTIESIEIDLSESFLHLKNTLPKDVQNNALAMANTRARLRMTTLYAIAGVHGVLVAGTGNKVEDFGVGFYTKYGDGGVDLSPIADLMKSQVFDLAEHLGVIESILSAEPTDGLWEEKRVDVDQLGASYDEMEWAMLYLEKEKKEPISENQQKILEHYQKLNRANKHKMIPIPVCEIPEKYLN